jgi:chemotaxis protein MotB
MARKQQHPSHESHDRWLVSYADFITLLFAFFVVMFASSQADKSRAAQVSESVKGALEKGGMRAVVREILGGTVDDKGKGNAMMRGPGGEAKQKTPPPDVVPKPTTVVELTPSMKYLTKNLETEIKDGKIELKLTPRGLVISLREASFFPSGGEEIIPASYGTLGKIGHLLGTLPNPVLLEGHTDSIPIHTSRYRSNWDLSAARSIAMLEFLTTQLDLPHERFGIAGYADTHPIASNATPEGRAENRRVDVVILNQNAITFAVPGAQQTAAPAAGAKK